MVSTEEWLEADLGENAKEEATGGDPTDAKLCTCNMGDNLDLPILPSTSTQPPQLGALAAAAGTQAFTNPALTITMAQIQQASLTGNPSDTDDEKAQLDAYKGIMQGLHVVTRTLSDGYGKACITVQGIVRKFLMKTTGKDGDFVAGASSALRWLVKAVQPAIDCLGKSMTEQSLLLEGTWSAEMEITKEILSLYLAKDKPPLTKDDPTPVTLQWDVRALAFAVAHKHMEEALIALHNQLLALVHWHVPPSQAGVFLSTTFQVMCIFRQEIDNMVLSQTVVPMQVIPHLWGVWRGVMEGLSLIGPPTCPASWPASFVEWVHAKPAKKAVPVSSITPARPGSPVRSDKGKAHPGLLSKKSSWPQLVTDYWKG